MLTYKKENLTPRTLLQRQKKIIDKLFAKAFEYAIANNLVITSTQLEDDNWHCSFYLKCYTNNGSYINDKPTFSYWFSYREHCYESMDSAYKLIKGEDDD